MEMSVQSWLTIVVDGAAAVVFLGVGLRLHSALLLGVGCTFVAAVALMATGARYESPGATGISYATGFVAGIAGYLGLIKARYFKPRR